MCLRISCDLSSAGMDKGITDVVREQPIHNQTSSSLHGVGPRTGSRRSRRALKSSQPPSRYSTPVFASIQPSVVYITILHAGAHSAMTTVVKATSQRQQHTLYTWERLDPRLMGRPVGLSSHRSSLGRLFQHGQIGSTVEE